MMTVLRSLVPGVAEPVTRKELSYMYYNLINNQLIVHNTPKNHAIITENLEHLDKTPQQVAIEAKFLTISVNDAEKHGFNWAFKSSDINGRPIPGSLQTFPATESITPGLDPNGIPVFNQFTVPTADGSNYYVPTGYIPPGGSVDLNGNGVQETWLAEQNPDGSRNGRAFSFGSTVAKTIVGAEPGNFTGVLSFLNTMDGDQLSVAFDFLDSLEESELLSAPRVTTMNQKPAMMADFTTQYFVTGIDQEAVVAGGGLSGNDNLAVTSTPLVSGFLDGIAFSVTPQISGNQVRMWMNPIVTKIVGETTFNTPATSVSSSAELTFPITTTKSVWTNVIVIDGDTIVLGGLIEDNTNRAEDRLPYISDIPVIGYFFRGSGKSVRQSSLLIFVTPTIIDRSGARYFESDLVL